MIESKTITQTFKLTENEVIMAITKHIAKEELIPFETVELLPSFDQDGKMIETDIIFTHKY